MLLKPIQAFIILFVLLSAFAFGNEICDSNDREWSILTDSSPPSSSHWLIHNGHIIRKDILEKRQEHAFRYMPAWKAYEAIVLNEPIKSEIYLEPRGTRQMYLKWQGYSYFRPSYTEIEINKNYLPKTQ